MCFFERRLGDRAGGGGGGWPEISGGINQPLRVGRTPSLDAGQRSSPSLLRPQHHLGAFQSSTKWMCLLGSPALCREISINEGNRHWGGGGRLGGDRAGTYQGPGALTGEFIYSFPIPRGATLFSFYRKQWLGQLREAKR